MRRVAVVLVVTMVAGAVFLGAASASAASGSRSFHVSPTSTWSLQAVKTWSSGCEAGTVVVIRFDGQRVGTGRANRSGELTRLVTVPGGAGTGEHRLSASCGGRVIGSRVIEVSPRRVGQAAARLTFSPKQASGPAIWAGLLVGVCLLAATLRVGRRHS
jgi:hypothetical protein